MTTSLALIVAMGLVTSEPVRVGSKVFTESVILGDLAVGLLKDANIPAIHRRELGGTRILFNALEANELDVYPEYTGTISAEILAGSGLKGQTEIREALAKRGIGMSRSLGFINTYAIGMKADDAASLKIETLSDLRRHPNLKFGFSNEFMERADGWPGLKRRYDLPQHAVVGLEHALAYRALDSGEIRATELYSTDAEILSLGLRVLRDDLGYYPPYECVWLYRLDLDRRAPGAIKVLRRVEGRIDETQMATMNKRAKLDKVAEDQVSADFLREAFGVESQVATDGFVTRLLVRLGEHLFLVTLSLTAAIVVAIPLGVLAGLVPRAGVVILAVAGMIQTIPSLALLVFMIPVLGIGAKPAIVALFLYSLLPIIRNTATGLRDLPVGLRESAEALGLSWWTRLLKIDLPLASRGILGGIKTAAVINVGTATIGALIGAGGFGQPIITGLRRDDRAMILWEGAIPAAILALVVQGAFDLSERILVPRGLRLDRRLR
jgi:osmoprotectant transport system permease protein